MKYPAAQQLTEGHDFRENGFAVLAGYLSRGRMAEEMFSLATNLGVPSDRDGGQAVWPVQPKRTTGTFSQTAGAADFHTDSQYHQDPESIFMLGCHTPARKGGESLVIRERDIRAAVGGSGWSHADKSLLSEPVWRWMVPEVFQCQGVRRLSDPKPVLPESGGMAWRFDNLQPENWAQLRVAYLFHDLLQRVPRTQFAMRSGDLLLCCNRSVLHARTSFSDPRRLYYRVRIK